MKKILAIILCLFLLPSNNLGYGGPIKSRKNNQQFNNTYVTDLNVALKLGKETEQRVVVIFSASWCRFCTLLKNDLPTISEFDNTIICILDADVEKKLTRQFKVKTLPTSIMLNVDGNELSRITGYEPAPYKKWLKSK